MILSGQYQAGWNTKVKLKVTFLHCISRFEGTPYKKLQDTATSFFYFCCFTSAFISADVNVTAF